MEQEQLHSEGYNVVFRGRGDGTSNYRGIMTWTSFESKAEFDAFQKTTKHTDEIVAEGVTNEQAVQICSNTSLPDRISAAVKEATRNDEINLDLLKYHLYMALVSLEPDDITPEKTSTLRASLENPEVILSYLTIAGLNDLAAKLKE
jgi:hypothetical protein